MVELLLAGITSHCWRSTGLCCSGKRTVGSICSFIPMMTISSMQFSIHHYCRFICDSRKLVHGDVAYQFGKLGKVWITFLIFCKYCTFVLYIVDTSGHLLSSCKNVICVYNLHLQISTVRYFLSLHN